MSFGKTRPWFLSACFCVKKVGYDGSSQSGSVYETDQITGAILCRFDGQTWPGQVFFITGLSLSGTGHDCPDGRHTGVAGQSGDNN